MVGEGIMSESCELFLGGRVNILVEDDLGEIYAASIDCCWCFHGGAGASSVTS